MRHQKGQSDCQITDAIRLPNGMIYDNTDNRWKDLERAGKYARYLGLIPADKFQDRRSRAPVEKPFKTGGRELNVYSSGKYTFDYVELDRIPSFPGFPTMPYLPSFPQYSL